MIGDADRGDVAPGVTDSGVCCIMGEDARTCALFFDGGGMPKGEGLATLWQPGARPCKAARALVTSCWLDAS